MPVAQPDGQVPTAGDLRAIAHATVMTAALSEDLAASGAPASEIVVEVVCGFAGPFAACDLIALDLNVSARVPGLDAPGFRQAVERARVQCLRSAGVRDQLPGESQAELY